MPLMDFAWNQKPRTWGTWTSLQNGPVAKLLLHSISTALEHARTSKQLRVFGLGHDCWLSFEARETLRNYSGLHSESAGSDLLKLKPEVLP